MSSDKFRLRLGLIFRSIKSYLYVLMPLTYTPIPWLYGALLLELLLLFAFDDLKLDFIKFANLQLQFETELEVVVRFYKKYKSNRNPGRLRGRAGV